ncbi:hypothetical protein [Nitrosomonas sp.]|uniref:hypothetical protein n=1 Tax=Nitrosomonas sp. TaxID=42353 RepID=UPI0025F17CFE|nr:hypothetical protein [Nitrosomonas sp.]MBV6446493.1 hypothetical protein [Nitrosomonas sp.]
MKKIIFVLLISITVYAMFFSEKARLDREVDRLCTIDGGIKVYETVTLPADKFNERGEINFYKPTQRENALGPEYIFKWDIHYYKKSDPSRQDIHESSMKRDHIQIIRKSDMKLLGEFVLYRRAGGDLPGPWHPSSYRCPGLEENEIILIKQIFKDSIEGVRQ